MSDPIEVTSGFTPTTWATIGTGLVALFGFLGLLVRQWVPWLKVKVGAEEQMRNELLNRVDGLEKTLEKERADWDRERAVLEAERRLDNHRINNLTHLFDMMIEMIELNPDKGAHIAERMKAMREEYRAAEAVEKGKVIAAKIEAGAGA